MPWYNDLRPNKGDENKQQYALLFPDMTTREKIRCINKLLLLRRELNAAIPAKLTNQNLLIASWNIKELGHTTQRKPEAYFYIAEILNRFDLIAIQEIKSTLIDLNILAQLLGPDWAYLVNDITEGREGNSERSAYIYNKKSVELAGIAGEITLWDDLTAGSFIKQLKRTPFLTGFTAGWKKFSLINLHLHPGEDPDDISFRKEEVRLLLAAIRHKLDKSRFWNENLIALGDFNFYKGETKDNPSIQLFNDHNFRQIHSLDGVDTNASETEAYDRMFFHTNEYFKIQTDEHGREKGGVFNFFRTVYTDEEAREYLEDMKNDYSGSRNLDEPENLHRYFQSTWRRNQMSDHFPIWVEIVIDSSNDFLTEKRGALEKELEQP